ncbi:MFS transporter [Pseudonocardia adelaidensis]
MRPHHVAHRRGTAAGKQPGAQLIQRDQLIRQPLDHPGINQVATVAHADVLGVDPGVLIAAIASGGVLASFLYGGVAVPGRLSVHLGVCLVAYGVLIATMGTTPGLLISTIVLVLIGAATGLADTIESLLVSKRTPAAAPAQTHAFSVSSRPTGSASRSEARWPEVRPSTCRSVARTSLEA